MVGVDPPGQVEMRHPAPLWTVLAFGGPALLVAAAFQPQLLPAALQPGTVIPQLGGSAALKPVVYLAALVHFAEVCAACYLGSKNRCSAKVTAWYMLLAAVYGYPGWQPMIAQLKTDKQT